MVGPKKNISEVSNLKPSTTLLFAHFLQRVALVVESPHDVRSLA